MAPRNIVRRLLGRAAVFALGFSGALRATEICPVTGACNSDWQTFLNPIYHAAGPGTIGTAYFDGWSWDGVNENIAYFIEGGGAFTGNPYSPNAHLPFWGNPDGSAVPSFYFKSDGQLQIATLVLENTQWASVDSLGWYDPNSSAWGWIFQANGSVPAIPTTVAFTPTSQFGLFFIPNNLSFSPTGAPFSTDPAYFTNAALNGIALADQQYASSNNIALGPESAYQHFTAFNDQSGGMYISVNDRSTQVSDSDYNDLVLHLTAAPEPRTIGLAIVALAGGVFFIRRRTRRRAPSSAE